nr:serine/threonine protein kinase [Myxococcota bacterium]
MRKDQEERTVVERIDPLVGQLFSGRFRIVEKIAAGGFGAIYRAQYVASGHDVAIKVLHTSLAADPNVIARFRREGTTLSQLRAPATVTTYEFGETPDGVLYIVMELLRGVSLQERLRERGQLGWREALGIARSVCESLAEAHELGIIHRDLKPANIQLVRRGDLEDVKVLDFGIAKIRRGVSLDDGADLTNAGQMVGTIDYMAPEQILGAAADGRCDLFTLGIVIFEMIAGRRPFADSVTPTSMLAALLTQTPPRLSSRVPVPPGLDELVIRCLAREPQDRFASVHELAAALDAILGDVPGDSETRQIDVSASIRPIIVDEEATMIAAERYLPPRARPQRSATIASSSPPAPPARPTPLTLPAPAASPTQPAPPARRTRRDSTPPPRRVVQPPPQPRLPPPPGPRVSVN